MEIGSLLKLSSKVIYSKGKRLMVEVWATVNDPLKNEKIRTNRFYFTFECPDLKSNLKTVMPQTYEEGALPAIVGEALTAADVSSRFAAMYYLEGKRKFELSQNRASGVAFGN